MNPKEILIVSIAYLPNIGGVETHIKDLINELLNSNWRVRLLTYQPLQTPKRGLWIEKGKNLFIYRLPMIRGLFYKLVKLPFLEFLFLAPLLFLFTPLVLIVHKNISVINAQGIVAGFVAAFWSKVFNKRYVIATQSVYHFPKTGLYKAFAKWIFENADHILVISKQSGEDVGSLGVDKKKIQVFTHWEDINRFTPSDKYKAKKIVGFGNKFVVSFFGRLVAEKGVSELLDSVRSLNKNITLAIYGEGPLRQLVERKSKKYKSLVYMKTIPPESLPLHYSAADLVIVPSVHEEGFGRVAAGALLCKTPVIASNRGALPEVVNDKVGKIIEVTPKNIAESINFFFTHPTELKKRAVLARDYAVKKFSNKNAEAIIDSFIIE